MKRKKVQHGVLVTGKAFHAFAPTAAASRGVQQREGFDGANTLASLLVNPKQQEKIKGGYVWVDEAGLLGVKDMNRLFAIIKRQDARLLLTGDTRQHTAVARGDALRILEVDGKVPVARVSKIQRQKQHPLFKQVIAFAAKGELDKALFQLDGQGGIVEEADSQKRLNVLAEEYSALTSLKKNCLVIAPTHIEGRDVTQAIRANLKQKGLLENEERREVSYRPLHLFDEISYATGQGITLYSGLATVGIVGRNLGALYQILLLKRVREVREFVQEPVEESALCVEAILIQSEYEMRM